MPGDSSTLNWTKSSIYVKSEQPWHIIALTVHRVHRLESHYFGSLGVWALQQFLQVSAVVVAEDETLCSTVPDALNHRGMVPCIWVDLTACTSQRTQHTSGDRASNLRHTIMYESWDEYSFCPVCESRNIITAHLEMCQCPGCHHLK